MTTFYRTASTYQQGSRTMPGAFYCSPEIYADERDRIFAREWNCVGRSSRIPAAGDFLARTVAGESLLIVRGRDGVARALFNVCRHRGTQLCAETSGHFAATIRCPYHAWTYAIDGQLIGAPHMQEVSGFEKRDYPLRAAALVERNGFIFVNIADEPPAFDAWFAPLSARIARFGLDALVGQHTVTYEIAANWKLVFQNYSECLHCPVIHPELAAVLPYQSGANDLIEGPFLGGCMALTPPAESATMTGRACARVIHDGLDSEDRSRAYYYSIMPNMLLSIHPDYVNYYLLTPLAVDRTRIESEWMFHPAAGAESGFNPDDAIAFWDVTNRQDWDIVARSQLGIASRAYTPGPYSPRESIPAAWDREYLRMMGRD